MPRLATKRGQEKSEREREGVKREEKSKTGREESLG